jgi:transposase
LASPQLKGESVDVLIDPCAGVDVGKKFLLVCVLIGEGKRKAHPEIRKYGTTVSELISLRNWLQETGCTHVVMESTGSYWKPVFNVLEEAVTVVLANAQHFQAGRLM